MNIVPGCLTARTGWRGVPLLRMLRKQRSGSVKNHEARLTDEAAKATLYSAFRYDRRSLAAECMLLLATAAFDNQDARP